MKHYKDESVRFTNESGKPVRINRATIDPHAAIAVTLKKDWDEDTGLGEGGPWGWGGYTTTFVKSLGEVDTNPNN